jgi:outer membrane receptor for monomeric catechols
MKFDPSDPSNPYNKQYEKALEGVHQYDAKLGREPDENSRRIAASLTLLAAKEEIKIDKVEFSIDNGRGVKAGDNVFVVEGQAPMHHRAHMTTKEALSTPESDSFNQLALINQKQIDQQQQRGPQLSIDPPPELGQQPPKHKM